MDCWASARPQHRPRWTDRHWPGPDPDLHAAEARVEAELLGVELHVQLDLALGDRLLQLRSDSRVQ